MPQHPTDISRREIAIAIDFGGTKTLAGLVDDEGNVLAVRRFETRAGRSPEEHFAKCASLIEEMLAEAGPSAGSRVIGAGVTVPGLADPARGMLLHAPYSGWRNVPVRELLLRFWPNMEVFVANDVNACSLGERLFGGASSFRNVLWITVSTGIGMGMILEGGIFEGENGIAGEFGHIVVEWDRPRLCPCGNRGCLEAHASGTAIAGAAKSRIKENGQSALADYFRRNGLPVTAQHVAAAAREGIAEAADIYREAGMYLGRALSSAINLINPGCVVIGGGVGLSWDLLESSLKETLRGSVFGDANREVPILTTALGYEAGLKGAASLVFAKRGEKS
ncbi:ROK family protein [Paenibacillus thermotolerans]|uniref:ROK family protein n=1 Tax=Paenibacillus thermotolerans TaxID=3027807 RepID=UPI002368B64E|nr:MULTISPECIES: ROK family protein [unclassified Paenibacillus]